MTRIITRTPSTGKPIRISKESVPSTHLTIAEAPDCSVPDASNKYTIRDPLDLSRAIRPGEIFFLTPLAARNKDSVTRWIETRLLTENGETIEFGRIEVPAFDTAFIPTQGRSLFKRSSTNAPGDRFQVRGEIDSVFDVWAAGEEKLSSEHSGPV